MTRNFIYMCLAIGMMSGGLYNDAFAANATKQTISQKVAELKALAENGDAEAQFELGWRYANGRDGVDTNYDEAVKWYELAANQGHAVAQFNLASIYLNGNDRVTQDYEKSAKLFKLASDQGLVEAQYALGALYYGGVCGENREEEGIRLLNLAADKGYFKALEGLGHVSRNSGNQREATHLYMKSAICEMQEHRLFKRAARKYVEGDQ